MKDTGYHESKQDLGKTTCMHNTYIAPKLSFVIIYTLSRTGTASFQESFTREDKKVY